MKRLWKRKQKTTKDDLFLALQQPDLTVEGLEKLFIRASKNDDRQTLLQGSDVHNGNRLLHHAILHQQNKEVIERLRELDPDALEAQNFNGDTPVHIACSQCARPEAKPIIQLLAEASDEAVMTENNRGQLPFHVVCTQLMCTTECSIAPTCQVVRWFVDTYPDLKYRKYSQQNTILHLLGQAAAHIMARIGHEQHGSSKNDDWSEIVDLIEHILDKLEAEREYEAALKAKNKKLQTPLQAFQSASPLPAGDGGKLAKQIEMLLQPKKTSDPPTSADDDSDSLDIESLSLRMESLSLDLDNQRSRQSDGFLASSAVSAITKRLLANADLNRARKFCEGQSVTFEQLARMLLAIASLVAQVNKQRLQLNAVGSKTPPLLGIEKADLANAIQLGISIADKMLDKMKSGNDGLSPFDVFISYPGEDGILDDSYVPTLFNKLKEALPDGRVFLDHKTLQDRNSADPDNEMLKAALTARVVVCVSSYHAVQKKWPITELFCGLARAARIVARSAHRSPLYIDAMPGMTWLQSEVGRQRRPAGWVDDLDELFPVHLQNMIPMTENSYEGKPILSNTHDAQEWMF